MYIVVFKVIVADAAVPGERRYDVHSVFVQFLGLFRQFDLRLSFGDVVDACERTADVLVVPVAFAEGFSDVHHQKMHLVNIAVHVVG